MHSEAGNRVDTHSTSPARATVALRRERVVCQAVYCDPCYVMACGCATYALLATITSHNRRRGLCVEFHPTKMSCTLPAHGDLSSPEVVCQTVDMGTKPLA